MSEQSITYIGEVWQGGMRVARVESPDKDQRDAEIGRYAMQYRQDGPVTVKYKTRKASK